MFALRLTKVRLLVANYHACNCCSFLGADDSLTFLRLCGVLSNLSFLTRAPEPSCDEGQTPLNGVFITKHGSRPFDIPQSPETNFTRSVIVVATGFRERIIDNLRLY